MLRKIIILLLLFVCLVQGASAAVTSGTLYCSASGGGYTTDLDTSTTFPNTVIHYAYAMNGVGFGTTSSHSSTLKITDSIGSGEIVQRSITDYTESFSYNKSGSGTLPHTTTYVNLECAAAHTDIQVGETAFSASGAVAFTSGGIYTASGESCSTDAEFDIFVNGSFVYTDSTNSNYSFSIAEGNAYQIHLTNTGEWHNFTASGDEIWNPTCTVCTPPSGTQTAHGRGSEGWIDYFGYIFSGTHSDLILSGNGHFEVYVGGELFYNLFAGTHTIPFSSDFDGIDINVYFSNSTISGTWWNYTNHIDEDATWIIEGCGGEQGGISGTITDEYGDGLFGLAIGAYTSEGKRAATSFSDSNGAFDLPTLLEGTDYSIWVKGSGLDNEWRLWGEYNTIIDGLVWDIEQFQYINPTLEIRVEVDGSYEVDYSTLIIDHNAGNDSIIYSRSVINPSSSTFTNPATINWNDVLIRVAANGSTQDFSYSFSNVRDTQFNYPCYQDSCIIDIVFNSTDAPAKPEIPIFGNESNLTKDFKLHGALRGSDRSTGARAILNSNNPLVTVDCDDGSFGTSIFNYSTGVFELWINETSCSDISYTATGYIPQKFINRNWTEWDYEYITINRIPSECTTAIIIDGISETRINQESEFSVCVPLSIPKYTVTMHDPDGALVQSWSSLDGLNHLKYTYTILGTYTISITTPYSLATSKHNVIGSDGNVNWMRVSPLVVNKYLGSFKISYFSNSSFNYINLSSNGTSILIFNTLSNISSYRDIERDTFSSLSTGDTIDIYFMDNITLLEYAFVTLTGGTITSPCGTPDCKIIETSTTSSYSGLNAASMVNKMFSNTIIISILLLICMFLCIQRYYISIIGIWLVYAYEVNLIPNIIFFSIVTILILVFAYKITNIGGNE